MEGKDIKQRCEWARGSQLEADYHDNEWGVPLHDDQKLFELLILEGAQAGLSWTTILKKRDAYRLAYDYFDVEKVAHYDDTKIEQLLSNPGIVRNRLKVKSSIQNAKHFLAIQKEFGSFDRYIWQFVGGKTKQEKRWHNLKEIPAQTKESDLMSKDLKKRGFKFVGSTISYAFMQAVGMVNDHTVDCFRFKELAAPE
ncbi:MAG: DNA-3-methyladenine glycosylase I [Proteobacteria bacterium]|nr:DNA-3-methyladenine glycosylase I [Pseudomonadota bacterium]